ncbi:aminopeptidase P N-terminal domain-containing protein [Rapidithrix thailandica]|uniref:Xaa-Pro aminopeptidase n=1 Tax=Rapidithrix thailandica TaxID=413964 RepID=A0AAW9RYK6_9BACT
MRYTPISGQLFAKNRKKLAAKLKPNAIAIVHSNDNMPISADATHPFVQHSDLYYLTGIDQEESILVMYPDCRDNQVRSFKEILFIKETNKEIAIWEGKKLTKEEAEERSGIRTVIWTSHFKEVLKPLLFEAEHIYLNTNENTRDIITVETRDDRFRKWCMEQFPLHNYQRLAPLMNQLRVVKEPEEVEALKEAISITDKAFRRVLNFVKSGVWEYEIEAEIYHEFIRNRSRRMAYQPIVGSGFNACVLHYIDNENQCKDGDMLLMDFGAEYANYCADLSRTIPVNGRFTERQKAVYNAVLRVQKAAVDLLVPGNNLIDLNREVGKLMESELIGLGLLDTTDVKNQNPAQPLYKKYFMHGTSHHLGIDVHDYGKRYQVFEPGMVLTCEPGIYIREEALGIRLENDILITEEGPVDLMKNIPVEVEEIEELMHR